MPQEAVPHNARRPEWTCRACGEEWPCVPRRQELLAEIATHGETAATLVYLAVQMTQACTDLPGLTAGQMHDRFLGWARPPTFHFHDHKQRRAPEPES
jgi:hypothetical protein